MRELGFFVIISIVLHFLVSTSTLYFAEKLGQSVKKTDLTQIEILDPEKLSVQEKLDKTRQLIKRLKTTVQEINSRDIKARFESENTQRVAKETRASSLGLTQNAAAKAPSAPEKPQPQPNMQKDGDLPEFARARLNAAEMPVEQSTISNSLENDIQLSNATNLNTDANTYYSFYSRVEDLFYVRWVERNNYYWSRIDYNYKKTVLAGKIWSTILEVWLTSSGEYHSSYIRKSSGYKPFDEAAVFAFKDARFFPNPPRAKVEPDGFVRLKYRFNVHVAGF